MANKVAHNKKALLEALEKSLGIVTKACESSGIGRTTYYEYYRDDPEFKKKVDELADVALDFAESQLHKNIGEGKEASVIFYMKTKGRDRGYIEKIEQANTHQFIDGITFEIVDGRKQSKNSGKQGSGEND